MKPNLHLTTQRFDKLTVLISIIAGGFSYLGIVGPYALDPRNRNWLYHGINSDPIAHYLGWLFFKESKWNIPLGLNPNYGLEMSSTIVYSDSIPLMAILGKALNKFTTSDFQYFGIWILLCFIFQMFFAIKIINLFTESITISFLASYMLILMPMFIWRIQAHIALSSQFLILWAIYLILKNFKYGEDQHLNWIMVLVTSSLVHPYLLGMILVLWIAAFATQRNLKINSWKRDYLYFAITILSLCISCFLVAGYEIGESNSMAGTSVEYGVYRWNPISPLAPFGYSGLLRFLPDKSGNFDTFTYLGAGFFIIIALTITFVFTNSKRLLEFFLSFRWILVSLIALAAFAITNKVAFWNLRLEFYLPEWVIELFSVFSASARFIWPVIYFLALFFLVCLIKSFSKKMVIVILSVAISVQAVDILPLITQIRSFTTNSAPYPNSYLNNTALLKTVSDNYKYLVVLPEGGRVNPGFPELTLFSYKMNLGTNSIYLSRVDGVKAKKIRADISRQISSRDLNTNTIYVLFEDKLGLEIEGGNLYKVIYIEDATFLLPSK